MKALLVTLVVGLPIPLTGYLITDSLFSRIESLIQLNPGVTIGKFCEFVDFINLISITEMCRESGVFFIILLRDISFGLGLGIVAIFIIIAMRLRLGGSDQAQVDKKLLSLSPLIGLISLIIIFSQVALSHSLVLRKLQQTPILVRGHIIADEHLYSKLSIWLDLENDDSSVGLGYPSSSNSFRNPQFGNREDPSGTSLGAGSATKENAFAKKENVITIEGVADTRYYKKYMRRANKMANPRSYLEGQIKLMQRDPGRFNEQIAVIRQLLSVFE